MAYNVDSLFGRKLGNELSPIKKILISIAVDVSLVDYACLLADFSVFIFSKGLTFRILYAL